MPRAKLAGVSAEELKKEILRRQRAIPKLMAQKAVLEKKIAELQGLGEVNAMPKPAGKKLGRKRGRKAMRAARPGSLIMMLGEVLAAKGKLSVAEAAGAVRAAGYKSKSQDFQNIVGMTLAKDRRFKRVGRGVYALKG